MSIKLTKEEIVASNPNNMIVSDVLKDRLPNNFYEEAPTAGAVRVNLVSHEAAILFSLSSIETTNKSWSVTGTATKSDGLELISASEDSWKTINIIKGTDTIVRSMNIPSDSLKISIDFPDWATAQECIVTLTCEDEKKDSSEILKD